MTEADATALILHAIESRPSADPCQLALGIVEALRDAGVPFERAGLAGRIHALFSPE
jgi:hypothetical protein